MHRIACMYCTGDGVDENPAERGHVPAQFTLGTMYASEPMRMIEAAAAIDCRMVIH